MENDMSSQLLSDAVNEFSSLPGIGKKTALRLVLHLLKQKEKHFFMFTEALNNLKRNVKYCKSCYNISDTEVCSICSNKSRNNSLICVVENIQNVISIENTQNFNGYYHVLGGTISPIDGIGPSDLTINFLVDRIKLGEIKEVILALNTTMEGDATNFFIYRKIKDLSVKISILARGISIGDELEYTDGVTLGQSIINRTNFENTLK